MSTSNASLLTRSHTVYSAKKRAKREQVQEVVFDEDARREYLTGFRKRNLLKKEAKRKNAAERERRERLELRKQQRRELVERAAENVREVEGAFGVLPAQESGVGDSGNADSVEQPMAEELEFEDEEQVAVVTVVEDFAADTLRHPEPPQAQATSGSGSQQRDSRPARPQPRSKAPKPKARKVRYETKAARVAEKTKQRARRTEKAERAGGKKRRGAKR